MENYLSVNPFDQPTHNLYHEALQEHFPFINKIFAWIITGIQQNFRYKYRTYSCISIVEKVITIHTLYL